MISAADRLNANLFSFLFGSILTVSREDLALIASLGLAALGTIVFLYRGLVAVAVDEEAARVSGVPVDAINVCLVALAGVTVAISMRVVGVLLVAALMALPVMTALGWRLACAPPCCSRWHRSRSRSWPASSPPTTSTWRRAARSCCSRRGSSG